MDDRTATTIDPEALADSILSDQNAARFRTTNATRGHLARLGPEMRERLEAVSGRAEPAGPTT